MTIPNEIIEAVARSFRSPLAWESWTEKEREGKRDYARNTVDAFLTALTAHGYKITGPEVTEAMYGAY